MILYSNTIQRVIVLVVILIMIIIRAGGPAAASYGPAVCYHVVYGMARHDMPWPRAVFTPWVVRAGQGRVGQGRAGQRRAGQGRAGQCEVHCLNKNKQKLV